MMDVLPLKNRDSTLQQVGVIMAHERGVTMVAMRRLGWKEPKVLIFLAVQEALDTLVKKNPSMEIKSQAALKGMSAAGAEITFAAFAALTGLHHVDRHDRLPDQPHNSNSSIFFSSERGVFHASISFLSNPWGRIHMVPAVLR